MTDVVTLLDLDAYAGPSQPETTMIVMPANNSKAEVHYWAGKYGNLGHLYSPGGGTRSPRQWLPYCLDNAAFIAFTKKQPWDEVAFLKHTAFYVSLPQKPRWLAVPDVVGDKDATLKNWGKWADRLRREFGIPLAFCAQDGMSPDDVPADADVVFIGGSTDWKRWAIFPFCRHHKRVHVGRINTERWLWFCHDAGAESSDGTGWFRGDPKQTAGLENYLATVAGFRERVAPVITRVSDMEAA